MKIQQLLYKKPGFRFNPEESYFLYIWKPVSKMMNFQNQLVLIIE